ASVSGDTTVRAPVPVFVAAFVRRVESGLLGAGPGSRNRYRVTQQRPDGVAFRAIDWWTAINVGLNDVDIAIGADGRVRYHIRYARWAAYVLALSAVFGAILIAVFLAIDIRAYIAEHRGSQLPRLSIAQNVALAWTTVLFWGLAWP